MKDKLSRHTAELAKITDAIIRHRAALEQLVVLGAKHEAAIEIYTGLLKEQNGDDDTGSD